MGIFTAAGVVGTGEVYLAWRWLPTWPGAWSPRRSGSQRQAAPRSGRAIAEAEKAADGSAAILREVSRRHHGRGTTGETIRKSYEVASRNMSDKPTNKRDWNLIYRWIVICIFVVQLIGTSVGSMPRMPMCSRWRPTPQVAVGPLVENAAANTKAVQEFKAFKDQGRASPARGHHPAQTKGPWPRR